MLLQLKDHTKEGALFFNRVIFAIIFIVSLLGVLIYRLSYLQVLQHDTYTTLSRNNRVNILPLAPTRGLIYDSNDEVIAENITNFSLEITPNKVKNMDETLFELSKVIELTQKQKEVFLKLTKYKNRYNKIPIKNKLSEEEVAQFEIAKYRFAGVEVNAALVRKYPKKELFSHVLGYIGPITEREMEAVDDSNYQATYHIGKNGIEKYYEDELHGLSGYEHVETDARGRVVRELKTHYPQPGKNLHLTIDSRVQQAAFDALGNNRGAVVAINPQNGEIISLVSKPSYDSNLFVQGIDHTTYNNLLNSKDRRLFNRAIQGQYPPGSTVKPMVALIGLHKNIINSKTIIYDPGWFRFNDDDRIHRDWKRSGHGRTNLKKAISESCDTYFYTIANDIGIDSLSEAFKSFGLGQKTNLDIVGEVGGLVPNREWKFQKKEQAWYPGDTINTVIGQGYMLATPLQMAYSTANLSLRGSKKLTLKLIKEREVHEEELNSNLNKFSAKNWEHVIDGMENTVKSPYGTAHRISRGLRYTVAGKTGTTQVFTLQEDEEYDDKSTEEHLRDHSWFIAFAPVEKPQIALAVLVENNKGASKVARKVMDAYFDMVGY